MRMNIRPVTTIIIVFGMMASSAFAGTVRVDGQNIHVSEGNRDVFKKKYEGLSFDEALTAITKHVEGGKAQ